jgi:hypothetical protein
METANPIATETRTKAKGHSHAALLARLKPLLCALLAYALIAAIIFYPVTTHLTTVVAGTGGDIYQSMWNMWWVGFSTLTLHQNIWYTQYVFWPLGADLTYQTMMPIGSLLAYPFQAVSFPFAYNLLFFAGIILSGLGMFVLADYIVKNKYAAFISGVLFAFSAFHIAQVYGHLNYANLEWVPITIYLFLRIINKDFHNWKHSKYLYAAALSVSLILLLFMGDIETGIMTMMVLVLIFLFYAAKKEYRHKVINKQFFLLMLLFVALTFVLGSWAFVRFIAALSPSNTVTTNQLNDILHNVLWSDDLLSFLVPSYYNGIFHGLSQTYAAALYGSDPTETVSYIGYVALALSLFGIYKQRKHTYLWVIIGVIFFLLSLGPYMIAGGHLTGVPGPYLLLKSIPGLNILREPGRFDMVVSLMVAVLAAYGAKELFDRVKTGPNTAHMRLFALVLISTLILIETCAPPLSGAFVSQTTTSVHISDFYSAIRNVSSNFSMLVLPILPNPNSDTPNLYPGKAMLAAAYSQRPVMGGYLTRPNDTDTLYLYNLPLAVSVQNIESGLPAAFLSPINENFTNQTLLLLYLYRTSVVSLDTEAFNETAGQMLVSYLIDTFGQPIYNDNTTIAFSTANAVSHSVFKSFVAFPQLESWNVSAYFVNGANTTLWTPLDGGLVITYAPYLSNSISRDQEVNTTVNVTAMSLGAGSQFAVEQQIGNAQNPTVIAEFNLTDTLQSYTFNAMLTSGPSGNGLFFVSKDNTAPVGIESISFSRARSGG